MIKRDVWAFLTGLVAVLLLESSTVFAAEVETEAKEIIVENQEVEEEGIQSVIAVEVQDTAQEVTTEYGGAVASIEAVEQGCIDGNSSQEEAQIMMQNNVQLTLQYVLQDAESKGISYDGQDIMLLQAQIELAQAGIELNRYHTINVLGDSITEGVGASSEKKSYPSILARLTGAKVNNYGVSGSKITKAGYVSSGSFVDRMYNMDKSADLIIVFGGTNDFWFGDCPIGKRDDTQPTTFYGALNKIMQYLKTTYSQSDIVFITPYQQSKGADETHSFKTCTYNNFGSGTLKQYRTAILDRCQYYGIPVLDLYADYELNTVDNEEALRKYGQYLCDGCHLNDSGYNLLARKIYKFIMEDLQDYVPQYVEVNDMVFETAALPALVTDNGFKMPNGSVVSVGEDVELSMLMEQKVLYSYLMQAVWAQ